MLVLGVLYPLNVSADQSLIDKVYHPYVQPQEREFEWRATIESDDAENPKDGVQTYRFAYGQSLNEYWFGEAYLIGNKSPDNSFDINAVEIELIWQITEQGEYAADWGMLFELERSLDDDITELSTALLIERQWGKWVGTANLYLTYEGGGDINDEIETGLAVQGRYRYSRVLEPAIEFYSSDASKGIGPVLLGNLSLGGRKQLRWEAGVIAGLDDKTPDATIKMLLEFEF